MSSNNFAYDQLIVQDLWIEVNQLKEEMADANPRFKVEQLQKEKKELQHLVNKYQTQKHICIETASIATQTDEVYVITSLSVCLYVCMHV